MTSKNREERRRETSDCIKAKPSLTLIKGTETKSFPERSGGMSKTWVEKRGRIGTNTSHERVQRGNNRFYENLTMLNVSMTKIGNKNAVFARESGKS